MARSDVAMYRGFRGNWISFGPVNPRASVARLTARLMGSTALFNALGFVTPEPRSSLWRVDWSPSPPVGRASGYSARSPLVRQSRGRRGPGGGGGWWSDYVRATPRVWV